MNADWKKRAKMTWANMTAESSSPISAWKRRLDMKYQRMMPTTIVVAVKKIALPVVKIEAGISLE